MGIINKILFSKTSGGSLSGYSSLYKKLYEAIIDNPEPEVLALAPGLYQTGAIALYEEQGAEAIEGMMITSWDDLLANGTVHVDNGVVHTNYDNSTYPNASSDALSGDLILPNDGSITALGALVYEGTWDDKAAFMACCSLTGVMIPDSVTTISDCAFYECEALTHVAFGNNSQLETIGKCVFYYDPGLVSIDIPNSVVSIGEEAFAWCENLKSVTLPNGLSVIEGYMFNGCTSLTSITLPDSVTAIGSYAFDDTAWLTLKRQENPLVIINNILVDGTTCPGDVVIPDGITSIVPGAFNWNESLTSIVIPDSLTSIGFSTFSGCSSLTSVVIPDSVTTIEEYAFESCSSLTSITFKGTVEQWNELAKGYCWNNGVPATYVQCSDGQVAL